MDQTQETLPRFASFIARTIGLRFSRERLSELEQRLVPVAKDAGYDRLESYLLSVMSKPLSAPMLDTLAGALTIGETYFLRDPRSFEALERELLPELVASRRATDKALRIWSAGCSTGEEPYTIAILLNRVIPDLADWNITLLATDINPHALERGRRGIYSQWSFRNAPGWLMEYFTRQENGSFVIAPTIRGMVRFEQLNLAANGVVEASGGANSMDIIFCRNVMLYFGPTQIERTLAKFHAVLRDQGWLFVGPTEVDQRVRNGFTCRHFDGTFILRKEAEQQTASQVATGLFADDVATRAATEPAAGVSAPSARHRKAAAYQAGSGIVALDSTLPLAAASSAASSAAASAEVLAAAPAPTPAEVLAQPVSRHAEANTGAGAAKHPKAEEEVYLQALALYQAGNYRQAADHVRAASDKGQVTPEALALAARSCANLGSFEDAHQFCHQAIEADRLCAQNYYLLSIILEQQQDVAAATTALKQALYIDHDFLLAYFALGNLSRQAGDEKEAGRNFSIALRLLEKRDPHEVLPEAEGLTAGRLAQMIRAMTTARRPDGRQ